MNIRDFFQKKQKNLTNLKLFNQKEMIKLQNQK